MTVSLEIWFNWQEINFLTSISFNLTPRLSILVRFEVTKRQFWRIERQNRRISGENRIENKSSKTNICYQYFLGIFPENTLKNISNEIDSFKKPVWMYKNHCINAILMKNLQKMPLICLINFDNFGHQSGDQFIV